MAAWILGSFFRAIRKDVATQRTGLRQKRKKTPPSRQDPSLCGRHEALEPRAMMAVVAAAYDVTADWGDEFQATIELQNLDSEAVDDWTLAFDYRATITSIWNATILDRNGDRYTIANDGWHADLEAGRTLAFSFLGVIDAPTEVALTPTDYVLNGTPLGDTGANLATSPTESNLSGPDSGDPAALQPAASHTAHFQVLTEWGDGFAGEITVQNHQNTTLRGWEVSFDFDGDIAELWNGSITRRSGTRYTVRGPRWNPDLSPGGTGTIRFKSTAGTDAPALQNLLITGMCDGPQPPAALPLATTTWLPPRGVTPQPAAADGEGRVFGANPAHIDIEGFDPLRDQISFGDQSAHHITLGKTASGELAMVNAWHQPPAIQKLSGVSPQALSPENFGVVANEQLRQDIGGVLSWEHNVGPHEPDTVYVRSHEFGVHERIETFDPRTMKLNFLYFGARAGLSVQDRDEGLLVTAEATGQSILLVGVSQNHLFGKNIEFHHDQIVEDRLHTAFGFTADQVTMVSRAELLTPLAPGSEPTDGWQERTGHDAPRDGIGLEPAGPTDPQGNPYTVVAATTDVSVLVDTDGLAYVRENAGPPVAITRADAYWQGPVPLARDGATIMAAARDDLGRLRVLDGTGTNVYAWILDDNGLYVGEEGPTDTSIGTKENLFQYDIDGDGTLDPIAGVNSGNDGDEHWGEAYFAPYVDMAFWEAPNLTEIAATRGTSLLTLAFVLATPDGTAAWGGVDSLALDAQSDRALAIDRSIADFQTVGGSVMVSFGGAADNSLAHAYAVRGKTPQDLADAYLKVIDKYALNRVDFDIEGTAIADQASITLRSEALALLQQARPDIELWYTLPVLPSGLTYNGSNVVRSALAAGVVLDGVNVMAMNYGEWAAPTSGPAGQTLGYYATAAAQGTHNQLTALYREFGHVFGWNQLGVTPMIGVNDITYEVFTLDDAAELETFARAKELGMLSMWSVARDNPGSYGQVSATASGLDLPAGIFSSTFRDYGTQNEIGSHAEAPGDSETDIGPYTVVAATTAVNLLVDAAGLAYVSEVDGVVIPVTRSDGYWQGAVPLTRDGATILAAARDDVGRLRVLDGSGTNVYAWILNEAGAYTGEEGPADSSLATKEHLFQFDIDGDGTIGNSTSTSPTTEDSPPPDAGQNEKVVAAYFPEWGIYGRDYQPADVPVDQLTHLIYAFANLTADGEMTVYDTYAATEKRFTAAESVTGEDELWVYPAEDPRSEQTIWGSFNQLAELKKLSPDLTVSIAVGGWTLSDHFSSVTSTAAGRERFAQSIVEFLKTYRVFDGIDFDWEYPGGGGEAGNSASPDDGLNYALLLADVRARLNDLGTELGRTYEISVASPGSLGRIAAFNVAGLAPSVDFFNVMTYDFHGTWESTTGHQSAFTGDPGGLDIKTAVDAYLAAGVQPHQIVVGAPMYTRAWSGVADGGDGGYDEWASGAAPGSFEAGNYDYKDLLSQIIAGGGWELYWDDTAQASYAYNTEHDIFSSFETTTSIALKADWADALGLGGMMFWDLSGDAANSTDSLLAAAFRSLILDESVAEIEADSALPDPIIIGGDGVIGALLN